MKEELNSQNERMLFITDKWENLKSIKKRGRPKKKNDEQLSPGIQIPKIIQSSICTKYCSKPVDRKELSRSCKIPYVTKRKIRKTKKVKKKMNQQLKAVNDTPHVIERSNIVEKITEESKTIENIHLEPDQVTPSFERRVSIRNLHATKINYSDIKRTRRRTLLINEMVALKDLDLTQNERRNSEGSSKESNLFYSPTNKFIKKKRGRPLKILSIAIPEKDMVAEVLKIKSGKNNIN
jgi:hypothetical protein